MDSRKHYIHTHCDVRPATSNLKILVTSKVSLATAPKSGQLFKYSAGQQVHSLVHTLNIILEDIVETACKGHTTFIITTSTCSTFSINPFPCFN